MSEWHLQKYLQAANEQLDKIPAKMTNVLQNVSKKDDKRDLKRFLTTNNKFGKVTDLPKLIKLKKFKEIVFEQIS